MPINDDWEPFGKALSNLPTPPASEGFVQSVMSQIRKTGDEEARIPWWSFWKIPALGFGFAAILFAVLTAAWAPSDSIESYLLASIQDPIVSHWVSEGDASKSPAPDEILQFALEKSEDEGGDL